MVEMEWAGLQQYYVTTASLPDHHILTAGARAEVVCPWMSSSPVEIHSMGSKRMYKRVLYGMQYILQFPVERSLLFERPRVRAIGMFRVKRSIGGHLHPFFICYHRAWHSPGTTPDDG